MASFSDKVSFIRSVADSSRWCRASRRSTCKEFGDALDTALERAGLKLKAPVLPALNFNRYFYTYAPPRPLAAIEADIAKVEKEILTMLGAGA